MKAVVALLVAFTSASAYAQIVQCVDGTLREASACPGARQAGVVANPGAPSAPSPGARQSGVVTDPGTRTAPGPVAVPEQIRGENAGQYIGRMEVYCVSLPPAQRTECRVQAQARGKLSSANDLAALIPESRRPKGDTPSQYMARWEVYCVSLPSAQRAECRVQANAQTRLYSANYEAAAIPMQTRDALKAMGAKPSPLQSGDCNPRTQRCN